MTLADALDELRQNLLKDDAALASGPDDRLWSDPTLVRYVSLAQRVWAQRTLTIRDNDTPSVCEVELETGEAYYTLHKSVRAVISARYDTQTVDMRRLGHALLDMRQPSDDYDSIDDWANSTGVPLVYSTDESFDLRQNQAIKLRIAPVPVAEQDGKIVYLRVARLPINEPSLDKLEAHFEIPDEDCLDMLEYAAWRAMRTSDIDGASAMADKHDAQFTRAVAAALKKNRDKMYVPMRFAVGSNGFAWGR